MSQIELELPSPRVADAPLAPVRIDASRTAALVRAHAANDDTPGVGGDASVEDAAASLATPASSGNAVGASSAGRPWSVDVHSEARYRRSLMIGDAFVAAIKAIARLARRTRDAYAARQRAASTRMKLNELDDRMLRDLGIDRSEISSLVAEIGGRADSTRVHAMLASHGVWR